VKCKIKAIQHNIYRNKPQIVVTGDLHEIIKMVQGKEEEVMDSCQKRIKIIRDRVSPICTTPTQKLLPI
jgi:hypothetical protein